MQKLISHNVLDCSLAPNSILLLTASGFLAIIYRALLKLKYSRFACEDKEVLILPLHELLPSLSGFLTTFFFFV